MPMTSRLATLIVAGLTGILAMPVRLRDREFNGSLTTPVITAIDAEMIVPEK